MAGGTYPAQIWGNYMSQVKRGCGQFPLPKTPFKSAPFFGTLRLDRRPRLGRRRAAWPRADHADDTDADGGGQPDAPGGGTTPNYDPDLYETPPQGAPNVQPRVRAPGNGRGRPRRPTHEDGHAAAAAAAWHVRIDARGKDAGHDACGST